MPTEDIGSYWRARTIALCFAETAAMLYHTALKEPDRRQPLMLVPFVVNASFACELFLKALAHRGGLELQGHNLSKLLTNLPVQERLLVDLAWSAVAHIENNQAVEPLESVVKQLSNSFVEWRYSHEKERVSTASSPSILMLSRSSR
jgi:hypothetical protein